MEYLQGRSQAIHIHASEFLYLLPGAFQQPQTELDNTLITPSPLQHACCSQQTLRALVLVILAFLVHVLRSSECALMILLRKRIHCWNSYCYFSLATALSYQPFQLPVIPVTPVCLTICPSVFPPLWHPSFLTLQKDTETCSSSCFHQGSNILSSASLGLRSVQIPGAALTGGNSHKARAQMQEVGLASFNF